MLKTHLKLTENALKKWVKKRQRTGECDDVWVDTVAAVGGH